MRRDMSDKWPVVTQPTRANEGQVGLRISEIDRQKLLKRSIPTNFTRFVRFERVDGETAAVYSNIRGELALFVLDIESGETYWAANIDSGSDVLRNSPQPATKKAVPAPTVVPSPQAVSHEPEMHPMAKAYVGLSEAEQKSFWESNKYLSIEYAPNKLVPCKQIGFQSTDKGPIGAIYIDQLNEKHLFCISFKTGAPFRLSQPRPPKRP